MSIPIGRTDFDPAAGAPMIVEAVVATMTERPFCCGAPADEGLGKGLGLR